jgi:hypothetical protein
MKPLRLHQFGCTVPSSWDRGARTVRFAPTRNRWGASVDGVCPTLWMWWVIHMGAVVARCWCVYQQTTSKQGPKTKFGSLAPAPRGAADEHTVSIVMHPLLRAVSILECLAFALVERA